MYFQYFLTFLHTFFLRSGLLSPHSGFCCTYCPSRKAFVCLCFSHFKGFSHILFFIQTLLCICSLQYSCFAYLSLSYTHLFFLKALHIHSTFSQVALHVIFSFNISSIFLLHQSIDACLFIALKNVFCSSSFLKRFYMFIPIVYKCFFAKIAPSLWQAVCLHIPSLHAWFLSTIIISMSLFA